MRASGWYPARVACSLAILATTIVPLLSVPSVPLAQQPYPDASVYADMAVQIARGNGFHTRFDERIPLDRQPADARLYATRYAPGFPAILALFAVLGDRTAADGQRGARVLAIATAVAVFAAAYALGGPESASIAALVSWGSPFLERSAQLVMSDAFGALLAVAIVVVLLTAGASRGSDRCRDRLVVLAGFFAGYAILTRVSAMFVLGALAAAMTTRRHRLLVVLGAMPTLVVLAGYQWAYFGHPLRSGYAEFLPGVELFDAAYAVTPNLRGDRGYVFADKLEGALMQWTCPCDGSGPMGKASNLVFYPAVLLGLYWIYFPPLFPLLGIVEIVRRRDTPAARYAGLLVVGNVALMVPYLFQCARFVAPAALVLLVYSAAAVARLGGVIAGVGARRDT